MHGSTRFQRRRRKMTLKQKPKEQPADESTLPVKAPPKPPVAKDAEVVPEKPESQNSTPSKRSGLIRRLLSHKP